MGGPFGFSDSTGEGDGEEGLGAIGLRFRESRFLRTISTSIFPEPVGIIWNQADDPEN